MIDWVMFLGGNVHILGRKGGKCNILCQILKFEKVIRNFCRWKDIFLGKVTWNFL